MYAPPNNAPRQQALRALLFCMIASSCWYSMQIVHELGHVLGAAATGGRVTRVVLELFSFSRTDVDPNPRPLVVAWGGPLVGDALPLVLWVAIGLLRRGRSSGGWIMVHRLSAAFCGFCLIANGAYIALGSIDHIGDAGDLLRHGVPRWTLWVFGALACLLGLGAWHTLGDSKPDPRVDAQRVLLAGGMWLAMCVVAVIAV